MCNNVDERVEELLRTGMRLATCCGGNEKTQIAWNSLKIPYQSFWIFENLQENFLDVFDCKSKKLTPSVDFMNEVWSFKSSC